jgi:hypothetical protein
MAWCISPLFSGEKMSVQCLQQPIYSITSMNLINVVLFVTQDTTLQAINLPSVSISQFHHPLLIIFFVM